MLSLGSADPTPLSKPTGGFQTSTGFPLNLIQDKLYNREYSPEYVPKVNYQEIEKKAKMAKSIVGLLEEEDKKRPVVVPKMADWDKNF